jgi:hypothetical protein
MTSQGGGLLTIQEDGLMQFGSSGPAARNLPSTPSQA